MKEKKVVIVGTPCVGKTTLARHLARQLTCPHIEIDALIYSPHWTPYPSDNVLEQVKEVIRIHESSGWIFDGNYRYGRELVWGAANTILWLDYPLLLILWRAVCRTLGRIIRRERLWNGNREHLMHFLIRKSLLLFILRDWHQRHQEFPQTFLLYPHLQLIRLRSPREALQWLAGIGCTPLDASAKSEKIALGGD